MTLKLLLEAAFSAFAETSSLAIADSRQTFNWSDPFAAERGQVKL